MSDRHEQARAEAEQQYPGGSRRFTQANLQAAFQRGWLAADANPQPHTITRAEAVAESHPDPRCDRYSSGDAVTCGWKSAYMEMLDALRIEVIEDE